MYGTFILIFFACACMPEKEAAIEKDSKPSGKVTKTEVVEEKLIENPNDPKLAIEDNAVVLNSDIPILGFQFETDGDLKILPGGPDGFTIKALNKKVLGFSLQGKSLPIGKTILAKFDGDFSCIKKIILVGGNRKSQTFVNNAKCK